MKNTQVDGGFIPEAACLWRVISAVFMHVQNPESVIVMNTQYAMN